MQYTVIEFFQSKTETERRQNIERLLRLQQKNNKEDEKTDAPA